MPLLTSVYSPSTPLFEVLRDPAGSALVDEYLPGLTQSSILHTLHSYPVGLVAETDAELASEPLRLSRFLSSLSDLTPATPVERRPVPEPVYDADYEEASVAPGSAPVTIAGSARAYERVEAVFAGPSHGNPYVDVELRATVSGPHGSSEAFGFYDGDGRYILRWLPETAGAYTFVTRSNARSLDGILGTVEVEEPASGRHGPVRVADTFHFRHADGTRHVPLGTTSYAWTHQPQSLQDATLQQLAQGPFTKLRMCVFPKSYLFSENEPEQFPFLRDDNGGYDFSRFDPAFWAHLETQIDRLAAIGVEADLILFHAYDRWGFSTMPAEADDRYVRYVVSRLSSFANVWWSLANEFDLLFEKTTEDWERFAEIVQERDSAGHLLSIHNCRDLYDHSRPWISHVSVQRLDVYRTAESITEWRETWGKPVLLDELGYEGDIDQGWGNITGHEMVRRHWEGAVRGGYAGHGETYLDDDDILWWAKGGTLRGTSPARIGFLRQVIAEAPGGMLEPLPLDWDAPRAGVEGEYYLYYFGFNQPRFRRFLYDPSLTFDIDVIDTWNMTVQRLPGTFSGRFTIQLPGRQFIAVRLVAR